MKSVLGIQYKVVLAHGEAHVYQVFMVFTFLAESSYRHQNSIRLFYPHYKSGLEKRYVP